MGESGDASLEWLSSFFRFLYVTVLVMEMIAAFVVDPRRVQRFHSTTVRAGARGGGLCMGELALLPHDHPPSLTRRAQSIFLGAIGVLTYVLGTTSLFSHYGADHYGCRT